jgi:CPA2 family monovalent cation:H+ antiporter-2
MDHGAPGLLLTLAAAFGAAFLLGAGAVRLRLPPLVGYLAAGIVLGPHSPGFVADQALASQFAEIGVILLMFGVGLHFSPADLGRMRSVALPGALLQMTISAALGLGLAVSWGWSGPAALLFGLALCVASTVVVLRVLEDRGVLDAADGRIAVGWLVVEDLGMILALVLLPVLFEVLGVGAATIQGAGSGSGHAIRVGLLTLAKVLAFIVLMAVIGRRVVPWLLLRVARTGSRELFTLAVLAVSLGVAVGAAEFFGVSFALGAFVAGVVISESDLSYRAGADALPMQDAFAVLFFVSAGMVMDPDILVEAPLRVAATVAVILLGNGLTTALLLIRFGHGLVPSLRLGAAFGLIGEFSFILAGFGVSLGLLPEDGRSLIMAAALCTIVGNPLVVRGAEWLGRRLELRAARKASADGEPLPVVSPAPDPERLRPHVILIGYGRVGRMIGRALRDQGIPCLAIEQDRRLVEEGRAEGMPLIFGDATRPPVLAAARPAAAGTLVIASPDPYQAQHLIAMVREQNPAIDIIVRTHSEEELALFESLGVRQALMGERELAFAMAYASLRSAGCDDDAADLVVDRLRVPSSPDA